LLVTSLAFRVLQNGRYSCIWRNVISDGCDRDNLMQKTNTLRSECSDPLQQSTYHGHISQAILTNCNLHVCSVRCTNGSIT
jgi:hypothetical protein